MRFWSVGSYVIWAEFRAMMLSLLKGGRGLPRPEKQGLAAAVPSPFSEPSLLYAAFGAMDRSHRLAYMSNIYRHLMDPGRVGRPVDRAAPAAPALAQTRADVATALPGPARSVVERGSAAYPRTKSALAALHL